jgi:hypothetical protein
VGDAAGRTGPSDTETEETEMSSNTLTAPAARTCSPAGRVTRSLLGYGVLAGPVYLVTSLSQALTRPGFDLAHHDWSLLANGPWGWIQSLNLVVTGLMSLAFATGLGRAVSSRWATVLAGAYGIGLVAAGTFRADPAYGFPVGTPAGPGPVSWHGVLHLVSAAIGFVGLIAACFVVAGKLGGRGWAWYSRATGIAFAAGFVGVATGSGYAAVTIAFILAVVAAFAWMAATSVHLYRQTH